MSANFYLSSHANNHLHPRAALFTARIDDLRHATEQELAWIEIWSAGAMQKICKRLSLRQQVLATAVVFFRRFYLRNSYAESDPLLVAAACCYVAAKAEETPVHVKSAVQEAKIVFNDMGYPSFPSDNHRLAEMEFYLLEELDFHLVVYHPYRALVQLCGRDGGPQGLAGGEEGRENRKKMLEMDDTALQMAWFIINDTYRSSLPLIHPPHLIAVAAIYLAFALHPPASCASDILAPPAPAAGGGKAGKSGKKDDDSTSPVKAASGGIAGRTRRASQDATASSTAPASSSTSVAQTAAAAAPKGPGGHTDPITFLASLQVDHSLVLEIVQEVIGLYDVWAGLEGSGTSTAGVPGAGAGGAGGVGGAGGGGAGLGGVSAAQAMTARLFRGVDASSSPSSPAGAGAGAGGKQPTPDERVLALIRRMQDGRMRELKEERERAVAGRAAAVQQGQVGRRAG
ncbi:hypothetical protein JCM8097_003974 [Rhodosporidiobolus ruineniae]